LNYFCFVFADPLKISAPLIDIVQGEPEIDFIIRIFGLIVINL